MELEPLNEQEVEEKTEAFVEEYLGYAKRVINYNLYFIEENALETPSMDYMKLKKFLDSAIDKINEIDESIVDLLTGKLLKDSASLYDFMNELQRKLKASKIIFKQEFLPKIEYYKKLISELELLNSQKQNQETIIQTTDAELKGFPEKRSDEQEIEHKKIKKANIDATHKLSEIKDEISVLSVALIEFEKMAAPIFVPLFGNAAEEVLSGIKKVTNTKLYYLNALLWSRAKDSLQLQHFFQKADIKGEISLKTFIQYYVKGVDMNKTKNPEWHTYLQECLTELN